MGDDDRMERVLGGEFGIADAALQIALRRPPRCCPKHMTAGMHRAQSQQGFLQSGDSASNAATMLENRVSPPTGGNSRA